MVRTRSGIVRRQNFFWTFFLGFDFLFLERRRRPQGEKRKMSNFGFCDATL